MILQLPIIEAPFLRVSPMLAIHVSGDTFAPSKIQTYKTKSFFFCC